MYKGLCGLFLLSAIFPYSQIVASSSYTQPYAALLAVVILAARFSSINACLARQDRWALWGLALLGGLLFVFSAYPYENTQEYKYLLNYLSPVVTCGAGLYCIARYPVMTRRILSFGILAWLFVGVVQWRINPGFMAFLVGPWEQVAWDMAVSGRGVLSLAPEPTHHALHMMLLTAAALLSGVGHWVILACLAAVLVLAKSSSALLVLAVGFAWFAFVRPARFVIAMGAAALCAGLVLAMDDSIRFSGSRMAFLIGQVLDDPSRLLMDHSTNARLGGLIATFVFIVQDAFVPHGLAFDAWTAAAQDMLWQLDWLLTISDNGPPSGYGILIFQGGWLVLPFLFIMLRRIASAPLSPVSHIIVLSALSVFLFQFYVSSPMFGIVYAMAIHAHRRAGRPDEALLSIHNEKNEQNLAAGYNCRVP